MEAPDADASQKPAMVWHRPEFQGRERELCSMSDAAMIAGVTRATVSNWAARKKDEFPAPVWETVSPKGQTTARFIVRAEFEAFLKQHRQRTDQEMWKNAAKKRRNDPEVVIADRIAAAEKREEKTLARIEWLQAELDQEKTVLSRTQLILGSDRELLKALAAMNLENETSPPENEVSSP